MSIIRWIFILTAFIPTAAFAQNTLVFSHDDHLFQKGKELLAKEKLSAAQHKFEAYQKAVDEKNLQAIAADYYIAHCGIRLENPDGLPQMLAFIRHYPENSLVNDANYDIGTYYFKENDLDSTITFFERVSIEDLGEDRAREARFKLAYAYFAHQDFENALFHFDYLKVEDHRYTYASYYYAGYASYRLRKYDEAIADLNKAAENDAYKPLVPILIANIYFGQKKYDELIAYAEALEKSGTSTRNKGELKLLVGTAYFEKKDYANTVQYLGDYIKSVSSAKTDAHYRLGYAQFQLKNYQEAINNFKIVVERKGELVDFATYYLGMSYLMTGQKNYAVNAFKESKENAPNRLIKEESSYNYGKLQIDLKNFDQGIAALKEFKKQFPSSRHGPELDDLLSKAYLLTNNYEEAITYIESIPRRSKAINEVYQKVTFTKASLLFNEGEYSKSLDFYRKSLGANVDEKLQAEANLWAAEAYYQLGEWENAEANYQRVFALLNDAGSRTYLQAQYGMGHLLFEKKQYPKALEYYNGVVSRGEKVISKKMYADAVERLADCHFTLRNFLTAVKYYDQAANYPTNSKDYIIYQKGVAYSKSDKYIEALNNLNAIITNHKSSPYYEAAYYKKGELQLNNRKNEEAVSTFTNFINQNPDSRFVPYAMFKRILAYGNLDQKNNAEKEIAGFIETYPGHELALNVLQELPTESDAYDRLSKLIKNADPANTSELVKSEYSRANSDYYSGKYALAGDKFEKFIENNPESPQVREARAKAAESFYKAEKWDKAAKHYKIIADQENDNQARERVAMLAEKQGDTLEAVTYYHKLEQYALTNYERYTAQLGLMNNYMKLNNYDSTLSYADKLLKSSNLTIGVENKAALYAGKSAYALGKIEQATDYFIICANGAKKDAYGAEATYMLALIHYDKEEYGQAIDVALKLVKTYNTEAKWIGKAYLLVADCNWAKGEHFQAEATAKSLLKFPDKAIVQEAQNRLDKWSSNTPEEEGGNDE